LQTTALSPQRLGEDPAASSLDPGAVVMIMATVGPAAVQRSVERLGHHHVEVVDAPVSGGVRRAAEGNLLIMVGGADSAVRRVQPVLDAMAGQAPVVGPVPGDGQKVKLVNQLLCGVHIAAAAEALAYAEAIGLDAAATLQVIRGGAAAPFMLDDRGQRMVQPSDDVESALDIFVKAWGSSSMPHARPVSQHRSQLPPNSYTSPGAVRGSAAVTTPR
jgi:3-hydroxyisobutyrate dehydrogenase